MHNQLRSSYRPRAWGAAAISTGAVAQSLLASQPLLATQLLRAPQPLLAPQAPLALQLA